MVQLLQIDSVSGLIVKKRANHLVDNLQRSPPFSRHSATELDHLLFVPTALDYGGRGPGFYTGQCTKSFNLYFFFIPRTF